MDHFDILCSRKHSGSCPQVRGWVKKKRWQTVSNRSKRKERDKRGYNLQESDIDSQKVKARRMEEGKVYKIIMKLRGEGPGFVSICPLKLSKALNKEVGDVLHASTLTNGALMITCKTAKQQTNVLKIKSLLGKGVVEFAPKEGRCIRGVIYNVSVDITEQ